VGRRPQALIVLLAHAIDVQVEGAGAGIDDDAHEVPDVGHERLDDGRGVADVGLDVPRPGAPKEN
jgi:hypothetical protein